MNPTLKLKAVISCLTAGLYFWKPFISQEKRRATFPLESMKRVLVRYKEKVTIFFLSIIPARITGGRFHEALQWWTWKFPNIYGGLQRPRRWRLDEPFIQTWATEAQWFCSDNCFWICHPHILLFGYLWPLLKQGFQFSPRGSLVRAASPPVSSREQRKYLDTDDILIWDSLCFYFKTQTFPVSVKSFPLVWSVLW